jgi:hypothetical protein
LFSVVCGVIFDTRDILIRGTTRVFRQLVVIVIDKGILKTEFNLPMVVFCVVTPCGLVSGYQRFGGKYRLSFQDTMKNEK